MLSIKKLLLTGLAMSAIAPSLQAAGKKDPTSSGNHGSSSLDTAQALGSTLVLGYCGYAAIGKSIPHVQELVKTTIERYFPKPSTEEGKNLAKSFSKATAVVTGITGSLLIKKYLYERYNVKEKFPAL